MAKPEKERKFPMPLKLSESIMEWVREQASKENRSINNFIETKLREIKDANKDIRID